MYTLRAVIIYRVSYSAGYPLSTNAFFAELSDYMESIVLAPEKLVIMGYSNIHVDVAGDRDASKLDDLFESFGLQQHVKGGYSHPWTHTGSDCNALMAICNLCGTGRPLILRARCCNVQSSSA